MRSVVSRLVLLLLSLSCALCGTGPWGSFVYDGLAVTLKGSGLVLVAEPLRISDDTQVWRQEDGLIVSKANPSLVFDVKLNSVAPNTDVIAYQRSGAPNQLWRINALSVQSLLTGSYFLKLETGSFDIVVDYALSPDCPLPFKFVEPLIGPVTCASYGDPHITCWSGTKFDFQQPGTVLLAQFNNHRILTVQGSCGPAFTANVTCNKGIAVKPSQGTDFVQITWNGIVSVNGVVISVTSTTTVNSYISVTYLGPSNYRVDVQGGYVTTVEYNFYVTVVSGTLQSSLCACEGDLGDNNHAYGLSNTIQDKNDSFYNYTATEPFVWDPTYVPSYGPFNITAEAYDACSPLQVGPVYDTCHTFVDPAPYYKTCLEDVSVSNASQAQYSIAAYSVECAEKAQKNGTVIPTAAFASTVSIPTNYTVYWKYNLSFTIQAKDALGNNRGVGGDTFIVTAASGPAPLGFNVADLGNGTYLVTYTPSVVGVYVVNVKLGGQNVGGTPITITVLSPGNIIFNGLAATFVGQGLNVALAPLGDYDPKQQWTISGTYFVSKFDTIQVFDSKDGSTRANNPLITWPKKPLTEYHLNQEFAVTTSPVGIRSLLQTNYYLKANGTTNIVIDYATPPNGFIYI